ncbi:MAG: hypothetical protein IKK47_02625 [Ruminococcus sp.]|nr:hypothetical protein [Ruminococcus sp.]
MKFSGNAELREEIAMPDQKLSLEDILNEYSPKSQEGVRRIDAQKILNSTVNSNTSAPKQRADRPAVSHKKSELFENALRQSVPADDFKPADLSKERVSVVENKNVGTIRTISPHKKEASGTGTVPVTSIPQNAAPKIRRMNNSTRAKELEELKRSGKKRNKHKSKYTYNTERPEGEYMYSPPEFKKKKRTRAQIEAENDSPEGKKAITDIVPSPAAVEAAKPVEPAPRAEMTSINLSEAAEVDASELDVHITQEHEEYLSLNARKKRTKRIVDFNYYGDVEDVGRDIYELKSTIGVRVLILTMTSLLSLFITLANQFGLSVLSIFDSSNTKTYLTVHLILGIISVISSMPVITKGIKKLLTFAADTDSMTAITALSCIVALVPAFLHPDLAEKNHFNIYMPIGIMALLINAMGKLLIIKRAARNFKFVSKNFDRHGVVYVTDEERAERLTRGTLGDFPILASTRKTDFLTDFLRYTYSSDMADSYCHRAAPLCMIASVIVSLFLTYMTKGGLASADSVVFGFSIFSMLISASSCIAMPFAVNIPLEKIASSAFPSKGIMLGYQSVDDFYDTNSILVDADSLFPAGSIKLAGIKVFSNTKIDEALLEAASLTYHAGSIMRSLFKDVAYGREDTLYHIDNFSYEESLGICGWINNKRLLFGNRELMTSHNIEGIPTRTKESELTAAGQEALYLSISGNLAAMFIVDISANKQVKKWSKRLCKNKICLILKSVDPCISLRRISSLFGIPEEMVRILPKRLHEDFDAESRKTIRLSASMATTGKFSSLAQLIIGTKIVHNSAIIGLIVQTVSIFLGFGLVTLMILSKAFETNFIYLSATALIIYNAVCSLLTCAAVSIKKL